MRLAKIASIAKQTSKKIVNLSLAAVIGVSGLAVAAPVLFAQPVSALSNTLYVATSGSDTSNDCLTQASPCQTINYAISKANNGDTVSVDAGTYAENVVVNKTVTLTGAGSSTTKIVATDANSSPLTFATNGATVNGFTITHDYTQSELSAWSFNNNGVTFNQTADNNTLENSIVTLNRNGVYLNNSEGNIVTGDTITNNRTGINMVNDLAGTTITNNTISDNWTEGLVTYGSSLPVNYSLITVSGNTFDNNWYEEVTVKDASFNSGTLDISNNTFTDSPVTYSTSSDISLNEPGFADQQPTSLGGTATEPTSALPTLRIYDSGSVALKYNSTKTINVTSGQSIQSAIDTATSGDTINVAAGTYTENVNVNKDVIINGAGSGTNGTVIQPTSGNALEVSASGTNSSNPLTIQNLRASTSGAYGIYFNSTVAHVNLSNVAAVDNNYGIEMHNSAVVSDLSLNNVSATNNTIGFRVATTGSVNGLTVTNSTFDNNSQQGWYIAANSASTTNQNDFTNISVSNSTFNNDASKGIYAEKLDHATFSGITVNASGISGSFASGFNINEKYGSYQNITIQNSNVTNSGTGDTTNGTGYDIEARDDAPSYSSNPATLSGVTISGGAVTGNQVGLRFGETGKNNVGPTSVTISGVTISGNVNAALNNQTQTSINASNNWWGSSTGPGTITGVIADPWYTNSAKTTLSNNTVTDATYSSTTSGQADLPSGVTQVTLDDSHTLDVSGAVNTASNNTVVVSGTTQDLTNYTAGNLTSGVDLTAPQTVGDQTVTVDKAVTIQSGTSNQPITLTNTNVSTVSVSIPDSTTVLAPSTWDGTIAPPKSISTSGTNAPSGFSVGSTAIEVGSPNTVLLFDKPVSVELDGVTGQVGYKAAGSNDWVLISQCTNNDYNTPQDPGFPGACSVTNGVNTIIWTYHFTSFASLTSSTTSNNSSSSSSTTTSSTSSSSKSNTGSRGSTSGTPEVLGNSTSTPNSATSSATVTKPAVATAAAAAPKSGKILGVQWYIWLIALAALAVAAYSANYVRTTTTTSKKK